MKKILFICLAVSLLTSCRVVPFDFYQIYTVKSNLIKDAGNNYIFENSDCKIRYNFWGANGNRTFVIENKTDDNMYIALNQSSFVLNDFSETYYQDKSALNSFMIKDLPIMCIAPHSNREILDMDDLIGNLLSQKDKKQAYPEIHSEPLNFTEENSPTKFRYYIVYSFSPDLNNTNMIYTNFFVESVTNYKAKAKNKNVKIGDDKYIDILNTLQSPNKFYRGYYK